MDIPADYRRSGKKCLVLGDRFSELSETYRPAQFLPDDK